MIVLVSAMLYLAGGSCFGKRTAYDSKLKFLLVYV